MTISTYLNFFKKFISHKLYTVIDKPYKSIFFDTWDLKYTFFLYSLSFFFCYQLSIYTFFLHPLNTNSVSLSIWKILFFTYVERQLSLAFDLKYTFFLQAFEHQLSFTLDICQTTTQSCPLFIWNTIRRKKTFQVCLYIAKVKV